MSAALLLALGAWLATDASSFFLRGDALFT
jgi:hypothetical protein